MPEREPINFDIDPSQCQSISDIGQLLSDVLHNRHTVEYVAAEDIERIVERVNEIVHVTAPDSSIAGKLDALIFKFSAITQRPDLQEAAMTAIAQIYALKHEYGLQFILAEKVNPEIRSIPELFDATNSFTVTLADLTEWGETLKHLTRLEERDKLTQLDVGFLRVLADRFLDIAKSFPELTQVALYHAHVAGRMNDVLTS